MSSASSRRDQLVAAAQGRGDDAPRFRRPHEPQARAPEIRARGKGRRTGSATKSSSGSGFKFQPARPFQFTKQGDLFGWHQQLDGNHFLGLYVETGRIKDTETVPAQDRVAKDRRAIPHGNPPDAVAEYACWPTSNPPTASRSPKFSRNTACRWKTRPPSSAALRWPARRCPPAAWRWRNRNACLPDLLARIEQLLAEVGLQDEEIIIRMTGCPNGCARPSMAELGFVGKGPGKYQIYVGGNEASTRLNRLYKETRENRGHHQRTSPGVHPFCAGTASAAERFGDFCERVVWQGNPRAVTPSPQLIPLANPSSKPPPAPAISAISR